MKKIFATSAGLILACLIWLGFNRAPLPPTPEISHLTGKEVKLKFKMNKVDLANVELALAEGGDNLFVQFSVADSWKGGRLGLVIDGMAEKSKAKGMKPTDYEKDKKHESKGKDFGQFMKDKKGKPVKFYTFTQQVAEGKDGKTYLKMSYDGPDVPMLDVLEVKNPVTIPTNIVKRFGLEKGIQLQPGTFAFDKSINGFWLPINLG
ncbi:MAG: hypothetical protein WBW88_11365 [Rhodothermales bacterium]